MKKWLSIACLWFACILIDQSLAHTNPCPEYWRYVRRGGNYEGYLTVTNPPRSGNVKVKLILSISGILPTVSINLSNIKVIQCSQTVKFIFYIHFNCWCRLSNFLLSTKFLVEDKRPCRGFAFLRFCVFLGFWRLYGVARWWKFSQRQSKVRTTYSIQGPVPDTRPIVSLKNATN